MSVAKSSRRKLLSIGGQGLLGLSLTPFLGAVVRSESFGTAPARDR